jgi:hypothetical protein
MFFLQFVHNLLFFFRFGYIILLFFAAHEREQ